MSSGCARKIGWPATVLARAVDAVELPSTFPAALLTAVLATVLAAFMSLTAHADTGDCGDATLIEHTFSSGASWSLCASVDERHALDITALHYRAPGDSLRSVLHKLHAAQILMHYHDEANARAQIGSVGDGRLLVMTEQQCDGTLLLDSGNGAHVCSRVEDNRVLAKFAQRPSLQSQRWNLSSALQRESLVWTVSVSLTEDGQIQPAVTLSGRAREAVASSNFASTLANGEGQLTRATVLSTWRMVFNLDDGDYDAVQQFDFVLNESSGNRRPMQITEMQTESFAMVARDQFRGWRMLDNIGTGYYLDPSNSGFRYTGGGYNWAHFDIGLSRYQACEHYASGNALHDGTGTSTANEGTCGDSLDDFVDGESLHGAHPVLWFSQSRTFNPGDDDWPVISNFHQSFTLLPFDWNSASPFEVIE